ncbi:Zn-dependent peptidase ImmA (M78 family) [Catenulispora sp. GAS73]|uniref:ImmA/IrrE family metallo-endopeptidase n=1 Tax=Catenulispora sp. GAS73 TaxID=3156269 RepID=UPI0035199F80
MWPRTREYNPWQDLHSKSELTLGICPLPAGLQGLYFSDIEAIAITDQADRIGRRCVLAHELAHFDLGHRQCVGIGRFGAMYARRQERAADQLAAERLVAFEALLVMAEYGFETDEAAENLDVTPGMLAVRLRNLTPAESRTLDDIRKRFAA